MNKLFLSLIFGVIIVAGASCAGSGILSSISGSKDVEGSWFLAFDLPAEWSMVREYDTSDARIAMPSSEISREYATVILQNTPKAIVQKGFPGDDISPDIYVTEGYIKIRVDRLDTRRVIPSSAQDLGNGFSFDEGKYYFLTATGDKYQFVVTSDGNNEDVAQSIILSAKEVTVFTDVQAGGSATEDDVQVGE